MTMNSSGPLSLGGSTPGQSIALELGRVGTPISFSDADVRALAGIPSGPLSLSDFYGKTAGGGGGTSLTPGNWMTSATSTVFLAAGENYGDGILIFKSDGSIQSAGNGTGPDYVHSSSGPATWYSPVTPGAGSAIWMRISNVVLEYSGVQTAASSGKNFSKIRYHFGSVPYEGLYINLPFYIGTWNSLSSNATFSTSIDNLETDPSWDISSDSVGVQGTVDFSTSSTGTPIVATGTFNVKTIVQI